VALGLPSAFSSPVSAGAPVFLTGDPRKEYQFTFLLTGADHVDISSVSPQMSFLLSNLFLTYISSLAEQVNLPPSKIEMGSASVSTIKVPYPKGFETPTFSVVYLEDEFESVYRFHKTWQDNIRGSSVNFTEGVQTQGGGTGLQFEPLGTVCCKAIYMPTKRVSISLFDKFTLSSDMPLGANIFPFVFPSEISMSPGNKSGSGVSKTTVVYTRALNIAGWNKSEVKYRDVSTKKT